MELGLGVHGEAGVKRLNLMPCREAIQSMLAHMTSEASATRLPLARGESVVVLVNNLGGLSQLELNVACKNVFECLGKIFGTSGSSTCLVRDWPSPS